MFPQWLRLGGRRCVCLAGHAPFTLLVMEKPFELPSHPDLVCIYTTPRRPRTFKTHKPEGTKESDRGGSLPTYPARGKFIPDVISMLWSSQVERRPQLMSPLHSSMSPNILLGWLLSVCGQVNHSAPVSHCFQLCQQWFNHKCLELHAVWATTSLQRHNNIQPRSWDACNVFCFSCSPRVTGQLVAKVCSRLKSLSSNPIISLTLIRSWFQVDEPLTIPPLKLRGWGPWKMLNVRMNCTVFHEVRWGRRKNNLCYYWLTTRHRQIGFFVLQTL